MADMKKIMDSVQIFIKKSWFFISHKHQFGLPMLFVVALPITANLSSNSSGTISPEILSHSNKYVVSQLDQFEFQSFFETKVDGLLIDFDTPMMADRLDSSVFFS